MENIERCMCRKFQNSDDQCPNRRLLDMEYCGKHKKCYKKTGRIDEPKIIKKDIMIDDINITNYKNYDLSKLNKIKLKKLLEKYHIPTKKKLKKTMFDNIMKFFEFISDINSQRIESKIIKLQALYRGKYIRDIYGSLIVSKCINLMDIDGTFFFNDKIINKEINYNNIFIFSENNFNYCFKVKSFKKNLSCYGKNPYTRELFSKKTINNFDKRLKYMRRQKKIIINDDKQIFLDKQKKFELKVLKIFQIIEELGNYVNHEWFLQLSLHELKFFYLTLKRIWKNEYRSIEEKIKILPQNDAFSIIYSRINNFLLHDKRKLQNIILNDIEKIITSGINNEYRKVGAWLVLTALTRVSSTAARSLSFLVI